MTDPVVLQLRGHVTAKKNNWRPRKGGGGIVLDPEAREAIARLAVQIPGRFRDLQLESPQIDFHFLYERAGWDRDNSVSTLLDLLVEYGVLRDDNIKRCNGMICIHPAEKADYDGVTIVLIPREPEPEAAPRYIDPRKRKPFLAPAITPKAPPAALDQLEDFEEFLDVIDG